MSFSKLFIAVLLANLLTAAAVGSAYYYFTPVETEMLTESHVQPVNLKGYIPIVPVMSEGVTVIFKGMRHQQCKLFRHSGDWSGAEVFLPKCPLRIEAGETVTMRQLSRDNCRIERISKDEENNCIVDKKATVKIWKKVKDQRFELGLDCSRYET